ncbi:DUF6143 family protein [Paenibacillus silvisoli]|uniref:DUF6143 family protein n=1 Tax=Paenibacillus silvisoli TaxID=3110539 RepID=UPI002805C685|nr:DUF6143 family protein [Paenibacillus silvisoli]
MLSLIKKKRRPAEADQSASQDSYFIGQTEALRMEGQRQNTWGGLFNPADSGVAAVVDMFAISNFSSQSIHAELWVNPTLVGKGSRSSLVHPSNLALEPAAQPEVKLHYASQSTDNPIGGVNVINRIISPNSTYSSDPGKGVFVIAPGGSIAIVLRSPGPFHYETRIVFRWREEEHAAGGPQ